MTSQTCLRCLATAASAIKQRGFQVERTRRSVGEGRFLAATPQGIVRLAFEDQADASQLRQLAASRRGSTAARHHLDHATNQLEHYLTRDHIRIDCTIDWAALADHAPDVLQSALEIPYATTRSYTELNLNRSARELGKPLGANPIPIIVPCHRVTRGVEIPDTFVGGPRRRTWLLNREQQGSAG